MSSDLPTDSTLCLRLPSDPDVLACNTPFEYKTDLGLCCKCARLAKLEAGSDAYQKVEDMPQCTKCGLLARLRDNICGLCRQMDNNVHDSIRAAHDHRGNTFRARMDPSGRRMAGQDLSSDRTVQAATQGQLEPTSDALSVAKQSGVGTTQPSSSNSVPPAQPALESQRVNIQIAPSFGSGTKVQKLKDELGSIAKSFDGDLSVSALLQEVLESWNSTWLKSRDFQLRPSDVDLRTVGNVVINAADLTGTISNLHHSLNTGCDKELNRLAVKAWTPTGTKHALKGPCLTLLVMINLTRYEQRIENDADATAKQSVSGNKRAHSPTLGSNKRGRGPSVFGRSTFVRGPSHASAVVHEDEPISVKFFHIETNPESSVTEVSLSRSAATVHGHIGLSTFDKGATKYVYKVRGLDQGCALVAKRFYDIGDDGPVTTAQNFANLELEVQRIRRLEYFLEKFYERAHRSHTEVDFTFAFTKVWLAQELGKPSFGTEACTYSAASGVGEIEDNDVNFTGVFWMLEPFRTSIEVNHWSGTMLHTTDPGRKSATMSAFAHFCYDWSRGVYVFADLQSTAVNVGGQLRDMLFDPMTHTEDGGSGVGDAGKHGIATFIDQHVCNDQCRKLQLRDVKVIREQGDQIDELDEEDDE